MPATGTAPALGVAITLLLFDPAAAASEAGDGGRADLALGTGITCVLGRSPACAGDEDYRLPAGAGVLAETTAVAFGLRHACALGTEGRVRCWGDAAEGQLGVAPASLTERHGRRPYRATPASPPGAPVLRTLAAGWLHTCGLTADGVVVCWGDDDRAQLGRSTPGPAAAPVEGLAAAALALDAGGLHSCAVLEGGALTCWGNGSHGQLGRDLGTDSSEPRAVAGLSGPAVGVAAGAYHTCALLAGGGVDCWGDNRFGQLGDGTRGNRSSPAPVRSLAAAAQGIAAGTSFSCALLVDGRVQCWGSNELGELGTGDFADAPLSRQTPPAPPAPSLVQGLAGSAVSLWVSGDHACAALADASAACWGANYSGQLGDRTVVDRPAAVAWLGHPPPPPAPDRPPLEHPMAGLDVSYHSGRVDWAAARAAGHAFGLTLATAGVDFRDPLLSAHWEGMRRAGLVRGAYHFFVAADDPVEQARHFLSHVALEPGDLVPVIDIESLGDDPGTDLAERLSAFIGEIEAALDVRPIIYTGPSFWNAHGGAGFGAYPLWIAEYGVAEPKVPTGWQGWHLWQWRGNASLPGVASVVDLNRVHPAADLGTLLVPPPSD